MSDEYSRLMKYKYFDKIYNEILDINERYLGDDYSDAIIYEMSNDLFEMMTKVMYDIFDKELAGLFEKAEKQLLKIVRQYG